jgi:ribA/ribD-fused uncharacterized protein
MVYSLDALRSECQNGKHFEFLFFWGHTPPKDGSINETCLSQWWMRSFELDGNTYSCSEQYMMSEKARLFCDYDNMNRIMQADSPKEMKALGRAVRNFDSSRWEAQCYQIVKGANKAKFSQNPELWQFLLQTNGRILVEASPRDRIWGIGMGKTNPDAHNPMKWRGRNLLGFALTEGRDELMNEIGQRT